MSALGQSWTSGYARTMSALPPKADIGTQSRNVRFVPLGDIGKHPHRDSPIEERLLGIES
jgi:hypothetical protein